MKIRIKNKKTFTIVLSIVLVLTAMISGTYSLFYHENTAQSKEDYTTGILAIVAKSKSDNINLTNALPMTDEEGVETDPYVFTIENTGNLDYNFNIRLLSTSDNPINPDYIKLKIDDGEVTTLSSLSNSIIKDNITLKAKEVMDVSIRIWLDANTPNTEIGKSFNSKIVTEGQAVYTELNNEGYINLVQHITNLYNKAEKTVVTAPSDASDSTKTTDYNYATSVNLMNDRLGGTTESLDSGNIRYYGAEPDNYIDIGDRTSNDEVILWRIIGVFDGKLRVVRDESIGSYSWDTSSLNSGWGINEWSQADLMKLLNPDHETNQDFDTDGTTKIPVNNSLYWNSESGKCYNGRSYTNTDCDFTNSGLSDEAKEYVVDQTLYLGGVNSSSIYTNQAYTMERGTNVKQNPSDGIARTLSWTGKVGIIYPSDYGYATDFTKCTNTLYNYNSVECKTNDWLFSNYWYWTMSPVSSYAYTVWYVYDGGGVYDNCANLNFGVRPVLTLSSEALVETGTGSKSAPYVLTS